MRTHNIPSFYRKIKQILIMPPDLALLSTLNGSNYPCLELIFMVPKVFEPLKFDCICQYDGGEVKIDPCRLFDSCCLKKTKQFKPQLNSSL